MRIDLYIPTLSVDDQINFYTRELALFRIKHDYGMGSILLSYVNQPDFCLQLLPDLVPQLSSPLFSISVSNCDQEFIRLSATHFKKGGLFTAIGASKIIEYPLGKTFGMSDSSGNIFSFSEWMPGSE